MVLSLLCDPTSQKNREKAVSAIKKIRVMVEEEKSKKKGKSKKKSTIREFRCPKVNLDAESYDQHLDLDNLGPFEPPLTKSFATEDLERQILDWTAISFPSVPSNTQAVERAIKLVTEVVKDMKLYETRLQDVDITMDHRKHPLTKAGLPSKDLMP